VIVQSKLGGGKLPLRRRVRIPPGRDCGCYRTVHRWYFIEQAALPKGQRTAKPEDFRFAKPRLFVDFPIPPPDPARMDDSLRQVVSCPRHGRWSRFGGEFGEFAIRRDPGGHYHVELVHPSLTVRANAAMARAESAVARMLEDPGPLTSIEVEKMRRCGAIAVAIGKHGRTIRLGSRKPPVKVRVVAAGCSQRSVCPRCQTVRLNRQATTFIRAARKQIDITRGRSIRAFEFTPKEATKFFRWSGSVWVRLQHPDSDRVSVFTVSADSQGKPVSDDEVWATFESPIARAFQPRGLGWSDPGVLHRIDRRGRPIRVHVPVLPKRSGIDRLLKGTTYRTEPGVGGEPYRTVLSDKWVPHRPIPLHEARRRFGPLLKVIEFTGARNSEELFDWYVAYGDEFQGKKLPEGVSLAIFKRDRLGYRAIVPISSETPVNPRRTFREIREVSDAYPDRREYEWAWYNNELHQHKRQARSRGLHTLDDPLKPPRPLPKSKLPERALDDYTSVPTNL
jgi:hypothetical protein